MPFTLVDPRNEGSRASARTAPRLPALAGKTVAFLDISKPGGSVFLDRLEVLLKRDFGVTRILRETKPTFARPAPDAVIEALRGADAVVEALAD